MWLTIIAIIGGVFLCYIMYNYLERKTRESSPTNKARPTIEKKPPTCIFCGEPEPCQCSDNSREGIF